MADFMSSSKAQLCVCEKCAQRVECLVQDWTHNAQKVFVNLIIIMRCQGYYNLLSVILNIEFFETPFFHCQYIFI